MAALSGKSSGKHYQTAKFKSGSFATATRFQDMTAMAEMVIRDKVSLAGARSKYPSFCAAMGKNLNPEKGIWVSAYFEKHFTEWCAGRSFPKGASDPEVQRMIQTLYDQGLMPLCLKICNPLQLRYVLDQFYENRNKPGFWFNFEECEPDSLRFLHAFMLHFKAISGHLLLTVMKSLSGSKQSVLLFASTPLFFLQTTFYRNGSPAAGTVRAPLQSQAAAGGSENEKGENIEEGESFTTQLMRVHDSAEDQSRLLPREHPQIQQMLDVVDASIEEFTFLYDQAADLLCDDIKLAEKERGGTDTCDRRQCVGLLIHSILHQRALLLTMAGAPCTRKVHLSADVRKWLRSFLKDPFQKTGHQMKSYLALAALAEFPELIVPVAQLHSAVMAKMQKDGTAPGHIWYCRESVVLVQWLSGLRPLADRVIKGQEPDPGPRFKIMLNAYWQLTVASSAIKYRTDPAERAVVVACDESSFLYRVAREKLVMWDVEGGEASRIASYIKRKFDESEQMFTSGSAVSALQDIEKMLADNGIEGDHTVLARMIYSAQENFKDSLASVSGRSKEKKTRTLTD
ncbi:hypothetical protein [Spongorhabdus nitratireducens]